MRLSMSYNAEISPLVGGASSTRGPIGGATGGGGSSHLHDLVWFLIPLPQLSTVSPITPSVPLT